jgi:hypothetical protein
VRSAYAHDAVVRLDAGGDTGAPGAAITVALCGHWEHEPPCPLAPHHTGATPAGESLRLRILFATEPEQERTVRERIDAALGSGRLVGPNDVLSTWQLESCEPSEVAEAEQDHAQRLMAS